jgi:Flp pilus assembly protein TadD
MTSRQICGRVFCCLSIAFGLTQCATAAQGLNGEQRLGYEVAEVLVAHHAYEEATPLLQRAVTDHPNDPRVHTMLGIVLRDQALYSQAELELMEAYRLDAASVDTRAALGVLYDQWGRSEEADVWHRRAIEAAPNSADFYNNLGFSLFLRKQDAASAAAFEQALRRDPTNRRSANNLGFVRARQGDITGALKSFQNAGGRAAALSNLGLAYELGGDLKSAKTFYKEALKVDKRLTAARRNLAALGD